MTVPFALLCSVFLLCPEAAPRWELPSSTGATVGSDDLEGQVTVLVFSRGFRCAHCAAEIREIYQRQADFEARRIRVIFVVADTMQSLQNVLGDEPPAFQFLADQKHDVFRRYGCAPEGEPLHGMILLDASGTVRCRWSGDAPVNEFDALFAAIDELCRE